MSNCPKCLIKTKDIEEARKLLMLAHNENVRLRDKLLKMDDSAQLDLDTNIKVLDVEPTITERKAWTYFGVAFIFGFFFAALLFWDGY